MDIRNLDYNFCYLKIKLIKYDGNHFPGWLTYSFLDINGIEYTFEEKVPVLFVDRDFDENTAFPIEEIVKVKLVEVKGKSAIVDLSSPYALYVGDSETSVFEVPIEGVVMMSEVIKMG